MGCIGASLIMASGHLAQHGVAHLVLAIWTFDATVRASKVRCRYWTAATAAASDLHEFKRETGHLAGKTCVDTFDEKDGPSK